MSKKKTAPDKPAFFKGRSLRDAVGPTKYFIDTGNFALNWICSGKFMGGGMPGGKIIEIFGPSASAKSLWGFTLLGSVQKIGGLGVLIDVERAANPDFVESAGHCNPEELGYPEDIPPTLEQTGRYIFNTTRAIRKECPDKPLLFVWDSISNPCEREWKEVGLPENYTKAQFDKIVGSKARPGERAREAGDVLRKLVPFLADNNVTLLVINQTRQAIGAMSWEPDEVTHGGGKALIFYAGIRLRTQASKKIMDTKLDVPIGVNLMVYNEKNRFHTPFLRTSRMPLFFRKGVHPLGGLLSVLINAGRVEALVKSKDKDAKAKAKAKDSDSDDKDKEKTSGWYKVLEPYAGGEDIKFRGNIKERNEVPLEIIMKCPSLVDASSTDELKEYLAGFAEAIEQAGSEDAEEIDVIDQDEDLLGGN